MLFNSLTFLLFFLVVTSLYYLLPYKYRWPMLLLASCYFYMFFVPVYILILGFTIFVDYFAGLFIEKTKGHKRTFFLVCSIVVNTGVLCVFKYYNFINENISMLLNINGYKNPLPFLTILLPIGLSFHTFQAMSYNIEVYRGHQKAEKHLGIYALYVMFYPQLVAGPIERPQNLLHQFYEKHVFDPDEVSAGLRQMMRGFLKKLVVADRLSIYVNTIYSNYATQSGKTLAVAAVFFVFQIYCDFSGYSDIAIGAARTMGFRLMTNFNMPLFSKSVTEFWRRWHISLSTWLNDYLFTPLVIRWRNWGKAGIICAVLFTFFISGLWHGAGWCFIAWGVLNGIALAFELMTKKIRKKLSKEIPAFIYDNLSVLFTFLFTTTALIFFRSESIRQAITIIKRIIVFDGPLYPGNPKDHFYYGVLAIVLLQLFEWMSLYRPNINLIPRVPAIRLCYYTLIITIIMLFGVFNGGQFIYFQF